MSAPRLGRQLALDLPMRAARGREAFFVSRANAAAVAMIDGWRGWPGGRLALIGPQGSGKTHLVHVWAEDSGAEIRRAADLANEDPVALAEAGAVAVEDADRIAQAPDPRAAEAALFHLHNRLAATGGALLVTGREAPARWALRTPDLASRLQALALARLAPPDDALLEALIVKLFRDRQVDISAAVPGFLAARIERSFAAAQAAVAAVDQAALRAHRRITRALAAEALGLTPEPPCAETPEEAAEPAAAPEERPPRAGRG
ncbi:DnaA/Hda family protein [Oceanicella actignis]|uniref:DnaA/Hda family protein n=1 Tax=Oceanicella actignis TaxID=1189325 RepID=UPI0011E86BDB|nr:DnaA/Hda family protein [Oceanicella actignis]TYO90107.1 DnaA protein [Oceanicella actignis]